MTAFSMIDTLLYIDSYHGTFSLIVQKKREKYNVQLTVKQLFTSVCTCSTLLTNKYPSLYVS